MGNPVSAIRLTAASAAEQSRNAGITEDFSAALVRNDYAANNNKKILKIGNKASYEDFIGGVYNQIMACKGRTFAEKLKSFFIGTQYRASGRQGNTVYNFNDFENLGAVFKYGFARHDQVLGSPDQLRVNIWRTNNSDEYGKWLTYASDDITGIWPNSVSAEDLADTFTGIIDPAGKGVDRQQFIEFMARKRNG
jgi:hypothetical protein